MFKNATASTLLEEFLSLLFEDECVKVQSGCADLFFNKGIRKLIFSKEDGFLTYKETELLRAASAKCSVRTASFLIFPSSWKVYGANVHALYFKLLRTLTFSVSSTEDQVKQFVPYIGLFKLLRVLDLKRSGIDDYCLSVLGINCKELRYTKVEIVIFILYQT